MAIRKQPPLSPEAQAKAEQLHACRKCGRSWGLVTGLVLLVGAAIGADYWIGLPEGAQAQYVGRQRCVECHQEEAKQWTGSHHDLAMDHATDATVLGDFNDAEVEHHGIVSKMFRRGEKFFINTEGPDGKMADFEIKYTFGVTPLQQYLVEFDRPADMPAHEVARLQTLRISWNTLKKEWFYLPPPDVPEKLAPDDDLHWTGVAQRWNNMCADCHSTKLEKNYDAETGIYHTTYSEIDVSCEACHGPGSLHVQLAEAPGLIKWDRNKGFALADLKGQSELDNKPQIETCAACHARRRVLDVPYPCGEQFHNFFANEVLVENVYHADGQIQDEDYEYGSFCQSKMFHKGIRCSDCHNPHSLKLKFEGNTLCTSCHAHPASKYDILSHHHHRDGSTGAQCVNCHMPVTTYMEVDPRRDHSLRIPRPDLSVELKTPNACTGCHISDVKLPENVSERPLREYADWWREAHQGNETLAAELARLDQWSADAVQKWFGENRKSNTPHFATTLSAARQADSDAVNELLQLLADTNQPAIARATAALELRIYIQQGKVREGLVKAMQDESSQVRSSAVMSMAGAEHSELTQYVVPLMYDPIRAVRIEAAHVCSVLQDDELLSKDAAQRRIALQEFKDSVLIENDRASAYLVLGSMYETSGNIEQAEQQYRLAMRVEPHVVGPRRNLAHLLDMQSEQMLRQGQMLAQQRNLEAAQELGARAFALQEEAAELRKQELPLMQRDAALVPDNAAVQHNLGLSLYTNGFKKEAEAALRRAAQLEPNEPEFSYILAIYYKDVGQTEEALIWAEAAAALRPDIPNYAQLVAELKAQAATPNTPPAAGPAVP